MQIEDDAGKEETMEEVKIVNNERISKKAYMTATTQVLNDLTNYLKYKSKDESERLINAFALLVDYNFICLFGSQEQIEEVENQMNRYLIQFASLEDVIQLNNDLSKSNKTAKWTELKLPHLNAGIKEVKQC